MTIVTANSRKMRPTSPVMNTSGMNTAASEIVIDRIVKLISLALLMARLERLLAALHAAHGVLQEHDRVVHQEPDRQRQRHQARGCRGCSRAARIAMNVISSDSGSATAGISVSVARPRNTKITITTRTNAMSSVTCTSATE